jgi:ABC-type lipoprotein export system ATPase subunit
MTIIVISHSERVKSYADNVYALDKGKLADAA